MSDLDTCERIKDFNQPEVGKKKKLLPSLSSVSACMEDRHVFRSWHSHYADFLVNALRDPQTPGVLYAVKPSAFRVCGAVDSVRLIRLSENW